MIIGQDYSVIDLGYNNYRVNYNIDYALVSTSFELSELIITLYIGLGQRLGVEMR